ncbi:MAG: DUF1365 domain-containing protein [Nitratireductor sp.]
MVKTTTNDPVTLYGGRVMHARMQPVAHRFSYAITSILVDLDRLTEANAKSAIFSVNHANLVSFNERHHGPRDGSSLRDWVDGLIAAAGLARPHSVSLLCYPTVLGYTFNPLSVYFCKDAAGSVTALVYQVHNTFGESHSYVEPVRPGHVSPAGIRQSRAKGFYVSPFMEMDMTYHFRISPPDSSVALRILETGTSGPVLSACFFGRQEPLTTKSLSAVVLKTAGITWKTILGIHYEALRLWLKGLKLVSRPPAPTPVSYPSPSTANTMANRQLAAGE